LDSLKKIRVHLSPSGSLRETVRKLNSKEIVLKKISKSSIFRASGFSDPPPSPPYRALSGIDREANFGI
jgi:hypothetical protein